MTGAHLFFTFAMKSKLSEYYIHVNDRQVEQVAIVVVFEKGGGGKGTYCLRKQTRNTAKHCLCIHLQNVYLLLVLSSTYKTFAGDHACMVVSKKFGTYGRLNLSNGISVS